MPVDFFNAHSHRKPQSGSEFVCRNAYHFLSAKSIGKLPYALSVGIHPWHALAFKPEKVENLRTLASVPQVLAIGECGLDRRKGPPLSVQLPCWEAQFFLAQELRLPLILHCVRAWQDLLPLCRVSEVPMLFHDFRGNSSVLEAFLPLPHVFFSFGKNLMNPGKAREVFCRVPEERFLLETDNSSLRIESLYQKAAGLRELSPEKFQVQMKKNTVAFFGEKALAFF